MCWQLPWPSPLTVLNSRSRIMREIGRTLRSKASASHTKHKHNKEKVKGQMVEIRRILGTLNTPKSSPDENIGVGARASNTTTPVFESGMSSALPMPIFYGIPNTLLFLSLGFNTTACSRLIRGNFTQRELPSLIDAILSSKDEGDTVHCLPGEDAQIFIDVINEARSIPARCRKSFD